MSETSKLLLTRDNYSENQYDRIEPIINIRRYDVMLSVVYLYWPYNNVYARYGILLPLHRTDNCARNCRESSNFALVVRDNIS